MVLITCQFFVQADWTASYFKHCKRLHVHNTLKNWSELYISKHVIILNLNVKLFKVFKTVLKRFYSEAVNSYKGVSFV